MVCPWCKKESSFRLLDIYGYQRQDTVVESSVKRQCLSCGKMIHCTETFTLTEIEIIDPPQLSTQEELVESEWR